MAMRPQPGSPRRRDFVLTLSCFDRPGIVFAVSGFLYRLNANIAQSQQHGQRRDGRFFMRVQFELFDDGIALTDLEREFAPVAEDFQMDWRMVDSAAATRTVIMVSQAGHCLNDLLFRWRIGALRLDLAAVVSNHRDHEALARSYGVAFHHIPVTAQTKADAEGTLLRLIDECDVELVVLARYMQILSDDVCKRLEGKIINIHHSFLPSFVGAKPYHQAHRRGVKLVGATAHYVTPDLDEGPIIEQDVVRVDHSLDADELAAAGRDVEAQVLARAVKWHCEHRVLLDGNRTIVFH
jgi:formyltetrahydrofolate deformylase